MKKIITGLSIKTVFACITAIGACLSIANYMASSCNTTYWDEVTLVVSLLVFSMVFIATNRYATSGFGAVFALADAVKNQRYETTEFDSMSFEANEIAAVLIDMAHEINRASVFIKNIEEGNIDYTTDSKSETSAESLLSNSLISMRNKMKVIALEEKERNWGTEGLARFVEILRATQMDVKDLANEIISKLVKYVEANQGGIFIYKDEKPACLEMVACYAYDRQKFVKKRIEIGEGLLGQCYLEKDIIYLTEIPENYVHITSGLGGSTPRYLLIVPLMVNEEVFGVMEIASFRELKKYQIEFVKKLGESIASTISNVQVNDSTRRMLEQSQILAEQMKSQEEELRQNMEELSATQEEMIRKEKFIQGLLNESVKNEEALKEKLEEISTLKEEDKIKTGKMMNEIEQSRSLLTKVIDELPEKIFLKDEDGRFMLFNSSYAATYDAETIKKLIGTNDFDNFSSELATQYRQVELDIIKANKMQALYEDFPDGKGETRTNYCVKMPFKLPNGKIGILGYQVDVTEIKKLERKVKESEAVIKEKEEALLAQIEEKQTIIDSQLRRISEMQSN